MTWTAYRVVFKLKSPMHIGCGKVGNVQRTRPYITGRSFWGALTMRLTRDATNGPATDSSEYEKFGKKVHNQLAYTYFYPAIKPKQEDYKVQWPWDNESQFRRRFLSSYASTALNYPQQATDEGSLHEVEFISPRTLDEGKQVFFIGYVFEKAKSELDWQAACQRLQIGGERGYGWGDLQLLQLQCVEPVKPTNPQELYNAQYSWVEQDELIVIQVSENSELLAHTKTTKNLSAQGEIEPLVGREWKVSGQAGQHVEKFCDPCWVPGSQVNQPQNQSPKFMIRDFGLWEQVSVN
ncbi:MAG: hypothetical protein HC835_11965 [Oscillatoriales cyanobacterium RM2_1_1]|nr:hypothetical protein [Oscillatoriales cyanobacterium SM2_3_0]NJO46281.1 hypothetical protein [Oscillatoriales cyanobacterium RM2_1_1]